MGSTAGQDTLRMKIISVPRWESNYNSISSYFSHSSYPHILHILPSNRVLVGKPEGRRPLGRPRRRWADIRMDLQEVECGYMNWIGLAQDRDRWRTLVSAVMNLRVP